MKLPNAERAVVDIGKLQDYCLNPRHPRGRHKARVFAARLGLTSGEDDLLRTVLRDAAIKSEALPQEADEYGQRFVVEFEMEGPNGKGILRSGWIVRTGEDFPRLTSCYVL